jgi:hypothetical protein
VVQLLIVALVAIGIVAGVATVLRGLRPAQRLVVLVGTLAMAAQVYYPPCLQTTLLNSTPVSVGRRPMGSLSYHPTDNGLWIDADRQFAGLVVTAIATAAVCGLLTYFQTGRLSRAAAEMGES